MPWGKVRTVAVFLTAPLGWIAALLYMSIYPPPFSAPINLFIVEGLALGPTLALLAFRGRASGGAPAERRRILVRTWMLMAAVMFGIAVVMLATNPSGEGWAFWFWVGVGCLALVSANRPPACSRDQRPSPRGAVRCGLDEHRETGAGS